jgi:DNA-binding transcriptional regulator LsrR (DeoR family)
MMQAFRFEQLALLARMRNSKAKQAAHEYLVNGGKQSDIAAKLGIKQATVSQAVTRIRLAQAQALRAAR